MDGRGKTLQGNVICVGRPRGGMEFASASYGSFRKARQMRQGSEERRPF